MNDRRARIVVTVALALALCQTASAQSQGERTISAGSLECGISGMLTSVDGTLEAKGTVRGGTFFDAPSGLWGTEAEISYVLQTVPGTQHETRCRNIFSLFGLARALNISENFSTLFVSLFDMFRI